MKIRNFYPLSILAILAMLFSHFGFAQNAPMLVKDIVQGSVSSSPRNFVALNNKMYFIANDGTKNQLYQTDGTANRTVKVTGYTDNLTNNSVVLNGQVYFITQRADDAQGTRILLYKTANTTAVFVDTLFETTTPPSTGSLTISNLKVEGNQLYYESKMESFRSTSMGLGSHNGQSGGKKAIGSVGSSSTSSGVTASSVSKVFYGTNTFYLVTDYNSNSSGFLNYGIGLDVIKNTTPVTQLNIFARYYAPSSPLPASFPFQSVGVIGDLFYGANNDSLFQYNSTGVRSFVKKGIGTPVGETQKVNNVIYFRNSTNQIWKTDGTNGGTTQLNVNFDTPSENIINLFGNNNATYIITLANGVSRTYYITPQGSLSRVNFDEDVTYTNPFSINGKQYIISTDLTNTTANCPVNYLIRYEQTENQSQFFPLKSGLNLCETAFDAPFSVGITDNEVAFYPLNTANLGRELYKLDLKPTTTSNCASKGTLPWEYWIGNVKFGSINNTSDKFKDFNTLGYSDYTNLTTALGKGQSYPLSIAPGLSWSGNVPNAYARAWIDFNNNNIFEANELVLEKNNANPLTANVLVPTTAVTGNVRMRVSVKFGSYPTACETFDKGEVEDYTVQIIEGNVNLPDLTLTNLNLTNPSVPQGQILNYKVDIKNLGTATASSNFNVKAYISTDNVLSTNDIQDGIIPTANFAAGQTVAQVAGASTIPASLAVGQYYLILKVDADNQITESNEDNNVIVSASTFTVTAPQTTNCIATFNMTSAIANNCSIKIGSTIPNYMGSLTLYNNANPSKGLRFTLSDPQNRGTNVFLSTGIGTTTPPTGKVFTNCVRNWVYYTAEGFGYNENRESEILLTNYAVRAAFVGNTTNPDSVILEISSSNNAFVYTYFISTNKTLYCNTPCVTDVTPPVITCPTTPITVTSDVGLKYNTPTLLSLSNISVSDNACGVYNTFHNYQFTGPNNTYPINVVAYDGAGNRATCNFTLNVVPTTTAGSYCASKGTAPWELWTSNVKIGTINNTSEKFKDFNTLGYSDYTSLSTTLNKGQSYPLSISPSLSWIGNLPNVYARVWIDFNNNKIFEASELVLEKTNANPLTANVLVPTTAATGNVRMRVSVKWGAYPTACETFDRGEVEDYTINIDGGSDPCANDVTPPVFTNCPKNQSIDVFDAGCQVFTFVPPTVTDNCTTAPSVFFVSKQGNRILSESSQSVFIQLCPSVPSSSIDTIIYTATDAKGNRATCSFELKFVNQCLIEKTIGSLPRNVVLTTSGNCAAYKWQVPSTYFPCQKGPTTYTSYNLTHTNPTVTVVRTPPSCQYCPTQATDSACFPIGRTVLIYNLDTFHVFVQKAVTGSADLALSITSTPSVFQKYTTQIFKIKAQNVGNQALTNVKIEFKRPAQTSNGGTKVASVGTFSDFCPGGIECSEWIIPTLAAGATATLDAPVFILDPTTAIVATTKLLSSTPVDGNAANNTASVTLTPATPAQAIQSLSRKKPTQYIPIIVQSIAPNPTEGDVVIEVESLKEQVVQFEFSNTMGQIIRTEKRPLEKGTNQVKFDVYELPDGVYLIQTDVNRGRFTPTKFVKF